jgi:hypothetical protein
MLDDPHDINRDLGYSNPYRDRGVAMGEGSGWGLPIALLAIVLIVGALFAFAPANTQQTAQVNPGAPQIERTTPAPAPVAPAPKTTAPSQPQ